LRKFRPNRGNGVSSFHLGHPQIHQGDIRLVSAELLQRFLAVACGGNHLQICLSL